MLNAREVERLRSPNVEHFYFANQKVLNILKTSELRSVSDKHREDFCTLFPCLIFRGQTCLVHLVADRLSMRFPSFDQQEPLPCPSLSCRGADSANFSYILPEKESMNLPSGGNYEQEILGFPHNHTAMLERRLFELRIFSDARCNAEKIFVRIPAVSRSYMSIFGGF
jgi:hypothetical protein